MKAGGIKPKVLLVDDDGAFRRMTSLVLRGMGFDITDASNGMEGLEKFNTCKFDAVVSDNNMPVMDGPQMIAEIKKTKPDMPVILLTAKLRELKEEDKARIGADIYLEKPVGANDLAGALNRIIKLTN